MCARKHVNVSAACSNAVRGVDSTDMMSTIKKYQRRPSGALHQAGGIESSSVQNEDVQNNRDTSWV